MRAKHAAQIRYGVELALKHAKDKRQIRGLSEVSNRLVDDIHDDERAFLSTRLERRAYWATRVRNFGMSREASRQGAAV
jgi:hypothetical protein